MVPVALAICAVALNSAFEYKPVEPSMLFPFTTAVQDYSAPASAINASYLPHGRGLIMSGSAGRPYSDDTLSEWSSDIQYTSGSYGISLRWGAFGADFYREHALSLGSGYSFSKWFSCGVSGNLYSVRIKTDDISVEKRYKDADVSILLKPFRWLDIGLIQSNLMAMKKYGEDHLVYPERSAGVLIRPARGFSFFWNITDTAMGNMNSFGAAVNPTVFLTVRGGYSRENSSLAASFGVYYKNIHFVYGFRLHPYLGYSHMVGLTYAFDFKIESLEWGGGGGSARKLNINSAGYEEIRKIEGISDVSARRLVLYRERIGGITSKTPALVGMTSDEVKALDENTYGMEREESAGVKKDGWKKARNRGGKYLPRSERIKRKFRLMIAGGIPSYEAINYSEMSESAMAGDIHKKLQEDRNLNSEQKRVVEKVCSE